MQQVCSSSIAAGEAADRAQQQFAKQGAAASARAVHCRTNNMLQQQHYECKVSLQSGAGSCATGSCAVWQSVSRILCVNLCVWLGKFMCVWIICIVACDVCPFESVGVYNVHNQVGYFLLFGILILIFFQHLDGHTAFLLVKAVHIQL